jgi:hypothetical protein
MTTQIYFTLKQTFYSYWTTQTVKIWDTRISTQYNHCSVYFHSRPLTRKVLAVTYSASVNVFIIIYTQNVMSNKLWRILKEAAMA